jgi:Xaa-Pro aminopeptidase
MLKQFGSFDKVPETEIHKRIENLKLLMAEAGLDWVLIYENVNRFYFSATMQKGLLAIPGHGEPLLLLEKGRERAGLETPLKVTPVSGDSEIVKILKGRGISMGTVGLELDVLPVALFQKWQRLFGFEQYRDVSALIRQQRMIKSPFEIDQLKKSGLIVSQVFSKAREIVQEGVSEIEIESLLLAEGRRAGHQGFLRMRGINQEMTTITVQAGISGTIPTNLDAPITGSGVTPAIPTGASFAKVQRGIPVTIDYGGGYNGYITDETRSYVVGELSDIFKKAYETARVILEDVLAYGKEGIDTTELFRRAYALVQKARLEEFFMGHGEGQVSFVGHGLGLEINEPPVITARHRTILKEGMVLAYEPKFVIPPHGAIGLEIDLIVRPERFERITADPLDLVCV